MTVLEYLSSQGISAQRKGRLYVCSSPFSSDSDPSFTIYPDTDSFYDWSTGFGGGLPQLISKMENVSLAKAFEKSGPREILPSKPKKEFVLNKYKAYEKVLIKQSCDYALSRKITEGFIPGRYPSLINNVWVDLPVLIFPHHDPNMELTGAKMRFTPSGAELKGS